MIPDHARQIQTLRELAGARRTTRSAILAFQSKRLRQLVRHAYDRIPYYRRLFEASGLHPDHIRSLADLERIPITNRSDIQSLEPGQICAKGYAIEKLRTLQTSGSTGMPVTVRRTLAEERILLAYRVRASGEYGLGLRSRRVQIDYLRAETLRVMEPQIYERFGILPRLLLDWQTPKARLVEEVERFRADILSGPPSVLAWLADEFTEADRRRMNFRLTITGAETLTPAMRGQIERGFGAPVADIYGSHEVVFIAMQRAGSAEYRVCEDAVILEVLRDGRPAGPGESGEVVVTALHSFAMPFLRYRLGDRVTLAAPPRDGEDPYLSLRSIDGRTREQFTLADGRVLHAYPLGDAVRAHAEVRRFQLVQEERNRFRLQIVLYRDSAEIRERVRTALCRQLGPGVSLQLEVSDRLMPEDGRKFQAFVALHGRA